MSNDLRQLSPDFSVDEAKQIAMLHYQLNDFLGQLPSERDQNFLFQRDQSKFILKISNLDETYAVVDMQNCALERINNEPRALPASDGKMIVTYRNHFVRLVSYLPGVPLAIYRPHSSKLLFNLGQLLGKTDQSLFGFEHEGTKRDLYWNMINAETILRTYHHLIQEENRRAIIEHILHDWIEFVVPQFSSLRMSVIHNDANDYNIIVTDEQTIGLIDFGDMCKTFLVCESAIACAYVMLDKDLPIDAATHVIRGYHDVYPFERIEIDLIYHFIRMRLAMSVTISAHQKQLQPNNSYLVISERPAWILLEKLVTIDSNFVHQTFRSVCNITSF